MASTSTPTSTTDYKDQKTIAVTFQLLTGADVVLRFPRACTNSRAIDIIDGDPSSSLDSSCVFVDAASGRRLPLLRRLPARELCDFFARDGAVVLALPPAPRPPPERVRKAKVEESEKKTTGNEDEDEEEDEDAVFRYRPPNNRLLRSLVEQIRRRRLLPDSFIAVVLNVPPKFCLGLILWAAATKLASWLGVGPPFLLLSIFFVIVTNLGTRKPGEASAYTIFNDFKPLLGELRAEQVDAGLRRGNL